MKTLLLITALFIAACSGQKDKQTQSTNSSCEELRQNIQAEYNLKNLSKTIELYKTYEDCLDDRQEFLMKLALLYKANGQQELCNEQLNRAIRIIKYNLGLSRNEKCLAKAFIYSTMDDRQKIKREISKINRKKLTKTQIEEVEFLELSANQGEFITGSYKVDFELFE